MAMTSLQAGQPPATPVALFVAAATVPATWVPCPARSSTVRSLFLKSLVSAILSLRSGCRTAAPLSMTAILIPWPRVLSQAASKPVFFRPHCWSNLGSSGV